MLRTEVLETMMYGCVTWIPRTCHYDTLHRAHHRFLARCIGSRKHNRADHEANLVCGICGARGGYETREVRDVRRTVGGRGLCAGPVQIVDGLFPG